jgi:hypothetical protein
MLWKDAEYKNMDQVVQCTELNKDPLQATRLGLLIFYDTILFVVDELAFIFVPGQRRTCFPLWERRE